MRALDLWFEHHTGPIRSTGTTVIGAAGVGILSAS